MTCAYVVGDVDILVSRDCADVDVKVWLLSLLLMMKTRVACTMLVYCCTWINFHQFELPTYKIPCWEQKVLATWLLFDLQLPPRIKSRGLQDSPSVEFLHPFFLCHTVVHHGSPKQEVGVS